MTGHVTSHLQVSNDAVVLWSVQTAGGRGGQLRRSTHHQVTKRGVAGAIETLVLEILEVLEVLELSYWKKNCSERDKYHLTEDLRSFSCASRTTNS